MPVLNTHLNTSQTQTHILLAAALFFGSTRHGAMRTQHSPCLPLQSSLAAAWAVAKAAKGDALVSAAGATLAMASAGAVWASVGVTAGSTGVPGGIHAASLGASAAGAKSSFSPGRVSAEERAKAVNCAVLLSKGLTSATPSVVPACLAPTAWAAASVVDGDACCFVADACVASSFVGDRSWPGTSVSTLAFSVSPWWGLGLGLGLG
eukprot:scaffold121130_cov54-Phaeocystis_antarctica.AAC.1